MLKEEKLQRLVNKQGHEEYFHWVQRHWTSRGEPLDFKKHKYLVQIYQDQSPEIVFKKSAQIGITERLVTEATWLPDQFRENSLYLFPTAGTVSDLVQERIDDPINNNPYLSMVSGRAKKVLGKQADKVGMKRMSKGFVYFRGSHSVVQITSVSADAIFVDELDRMPVELIPYFDKRLEHSKRKWMRWASTPTVPGFGIDAKYQESDQHEYFITCNHCGEEQRLTYWYNVDQERMIIYCKKCKQAIVPWQCEGKWIAQNPGADIRGYYIHQLYSPVLDIKKLVKEGNKTAEWEILQFYNQNLGLAYEPKGAKITEADLLAAKRKYIIPYRGQMVGDNFKVVDGFMGVDVGKVLHVVIIEDKKVCYIGELKHFEDLDTLMATYNVKKVVVDALPETRKAQEFVNRFRGRGYICYYSGIKEIKDGKWFKSEGDKVNTDRTMSLDVSTNEIKKQDIEFPQNLDNFPEFKAHLKNLVRVIKDVKGNQIPEYIQTGEDHFRHALNYANIAKHIFKNIAPLDVFTLK